jgi:transketolase
MGVETQKPNVPTGPRKLSPIARPVELAGNPGREPQYKISIKFKDGSSGVAADPKATRAMVSLMDMEAVMGGAASHFGGPSAFAELMSALHAIVFTESQKHNEPWHKRFHLLNDAGHCENGLYALKANYGFADLNLESLKGFRSIKSKLTGHGETHIFPEAVYLSNGPLGSCFPQAQGLAFADKLAGNQRVTVTAISDGACMEGEAREVLASLPGLAKKEKLNPFVLIISDNKTKLSGRIDDECFSMQPTFQSLTALGWDVIDLKDGHNLQMCVSEIENAIDRVRKNPSRPVAIHAHTIKGYGTMKTEQSSSGAHGFPLADPKDLMPFLDEIYKGEKLPTEFVSWAEALVERKNKTASAPKAAVSSPSHPALSFQSKPSEKVQVGVSKALVRKMKEGHPLVSISSDLPGSTGVAGFQKEFPQFTQDVGVMESAMVSMAAGLSREGFIPFVDTFAQFGVTKGALPLVMGTLSKAPVMCFYSHVGFQDAADGASHQALTYISMTASIPHTDVYVLTSSQEADVLVGLAIDQWSNQLKAGKTPNSVVFFLGRENFAPRFVNENHQYKLGEAQVVYDGVGTSDGSKSVTIVAAGAMLQQALVAAAQLEGSGVKTIVVNPSLVNRPDTKTISVCLAKTGGRLLTVEDHQVIGGMGSLVVHALAQNGVAIKAHSMGVQGEFGQSAYNAIELYRKHNLDADAIVTAAKKLTG